MACGGSASRCGACLRGTVVDQCPLPAGPVAGKRPDDPARHAEGTVCVVDRSTDHVGSIKGRSVRGDVPTNWDAIVATLWDARQPDSTPKYFEVSTINVTAIRANMDFVCQRRGVMLLQEIAAPNPYTDEAVATAPPYTNLPANPLKIMRRRSDGSALRNC